MPGAFSANTFLASAAGAAASPVFAFSSETSLGFYRSAASTIAQSYGTTLLPPIVGVNTSVPDKTLHVSFDHASTPAIKVGSGTDAQGWYTFIGNDTAGSTVGYIGNAFNDSAAEFQIRVKSTSSAQAVLRVFGAGNVLFKDGTATQPARAFSSEASLGLYRSGTSTLALSYGSFNLNQARLVSMRTAASLDSTTLAVNEAAFTIVAGSAAQLAIRSGGTVYYFASSSSTKG